VAAQSRELWGALTDVALAQGLDSLGGPQAEVIALVGTHTTQRWALPQTDDERWEGHGDLRTVADLTVDEWYGPFLVVMTWLPYAIGSDQSPGLDGILNDVTREGWSTTGRSGRGWVT